MKMKKLILLSLTLGLTFPAAHVRAGNDLQLVKNTEEPFAFEQLPPELKNLIIDCIWQNVTSQDFAQQLQEFCPQNPHWLTPVYFNTIIDNKNKIIEVGRIDNAEQQSGLITFLLGKQKNNIIINNRNAKYGIPIKIPECWIIQACALSIKGDMALVFKDCSHDPFSCKVTFIKLDDAKEKGIDLETQEHTALPQYCERMSALFDAKGETLGINRYNLSPINLLFTPSSSGTYFLDAPSKNKKLSIDQIAKRLGIPTVGVKKLLQHNRVKNNN